MWIKVKLFIILTILIELFLIHTSFGANPYGYGVPARRLRRPALPRFGGKHKGYGIHKGFGNHRGFGSHRRIPLARIEGHNRVRAVPVHGLIDGDGYGGYSYGVPTPINLFGSAPRPIHYTLPAYRTSLGHTAYGEHGLSAPASYEELFDDYEVPIKGDVHTEEFRDGEVIGVEEYDSFEIVKKPITSAY